MTRRFRCVVCKGWFSQPGWSAHAAAEKRKYGDDIYRKLNPPKLPKTRKSLRKIQVKNYSLTDFEKGGGTVHVKGGAKPCAVCKWDPKLDNTCTACGYPDFKDEAEELRGTE